VEGFSLTFFAPKKWANEDPFNHLIVQRRLCQYLLGCGGGIHGWLRRYLHAHSSVSAAMPPNNAWWRSPNLPKIISQADWIFVAEHKTSCRSSIVFPISTLRSWARPVVGPRGRLANSSVAHGAEFLWDTISPEFHGRMTNLCVADANEYGVMHAALTGCGHPFENPQKDPKELAATSIGKRVVGFTLDLSSNKTLY